LAAKSASTNTGGSGFRGAKTVAAADNVSDFQKSQAMQYLGGVDSLEGVEARVGRKDGEHILYVNGRQANFDNISLPQINKMASIINSMSSDTSNKEETTKEETTDDDTTENVLVNDLNVKATDDTVASELSAEKVNTEYEEIVDLSGSTFGPGKDEDGNVIVDDVVTSDTTFIDPAIKEAQEAAATAATALKEAMTFGGVVYENTSDLQAAIVAASAGGASMDQSVAGANTTASSGGDALGQVTVNEQNLNSSTLLGGVQEKAAAEPMSSGSAEDDAIDFYTKGRRSTILTTPVGLLNDGSDDGTFRAKRGLIA
jgi:hypothetical protein